MQNRRDIERAVARLRVTRNPVTRAYLRELIEEKAAQNRGLRARIDAL